MELICVWQTYFKQWKIERKKSFSINLPTARVPSSNRKIFYLFILSLAGPLESKCQKRQTAGRAPLDGKMLTGREPKCAWVGGMSLQSKQIKRQHLSEQRRDGGWGVGGVFYVDFICSSRESRNSHKQIEFCIYFLYTRMPNKNIKGLVCLAPHKCCHSMCFAPHSKEPQ